VVKRKNPAIEARRRAGEDLPPAPKTAIAGPEYFGFNQPEVPALPRPFLTGVFHCAPLRVADVPKEWHASLNPLALHAYPDPKPK